MCVCVCVGCVNMCCYQRSMLCVFLISSLSLWNMVSLNLGTDLTRLAGRWTAEIHQCPPLKTGVTSSPGDSDFYVVSGALSSGPRAWMASTLPAKSSYEPIPICIHFGELHWCCPRKRSFILLLLSYIKQIKEEQNGRSVIPAPGKWIECIRKVMPLGIYVANIGPDPISKINKQK